VFEVTRESLLQLYDLCTVLPDAMKKYTMRQLRMLRHRNHLASWLRRIANQTRRATSARPRVTTGLATTRKPVTRPNVTARAGRGFAISPVKDETSTNGQSAQNSTVATAATTDADLNADKLSDLEDELSKLRAEIDAIMNGGEEGETTVDARSDMSIVAVAERVADDDVVLSLNTVDTPEIPQSNTIAAADTNDDSAQMPPPPPPPMPGKRASASKASYRRTVAVS
jgi:hypothetical protein